MGGCQPEGAEYQHEGAGHDEADEQAPEHLFGAVLPVGGVAGEEVADPGGEHGEAARVDRRHEAEGEREREAEVEHYAVPREGVLVGRTAAIRGFPRRVR